MKSNKLSNSKKAYMKFDLSKLKGVDIWYAFYYDEPDMYYNYMIWQYSCTGTVDGIDGDERKYISIKMKDGDDTIDIMVFKESGYKNKKYPNPLVKLVIDAYEQKIPIACVYNEQPESNVMECVYTNFSVNAAVAEEV